MTPSGFVSRVTRLLALLLLLAAPAWHANARDNPSAPPAGDATATSARPAAGPRTFDVEAPIALLEESSTGRVLYEKNADQMHPPASITKIMTMLLVMEAVERGDIQLDGMVTVSARASNVGGSQAYLAEGEQFTVDDLLKAVAIHSANDACEALAEFVSGDVEAFIDSMNEKAGSLGMKNTTFHTPHGLPPEPGQEADMTTARDVVTMSRELILKHPMILKYTGTAHDSIRGGKFHLDNTNKLVGKVAGVDGLKTGFFGAAGFGLSATATRRGLRMISVVMGAKTNNQRASDSARLLNYGFSRLRNVVVRKKGEPAGDIAVKRGRAEKVAAQTGGEIKILLERGEERKIEIRVDPIPSLSAPIAVGQKVGTCVATLDGKVVGATPVVATGAVEKANWIILFFRWLFALLGIK